jgi:hypothetical protein
MTELITAINIKLPDWMRGMSRSVLTLLAAVLLFVTTACNGADTTTVKVDPTRVTNPQPGKITELYKPIAPAEGGMNNYSDVDPRQNTAEAKAKAERLIQKTEDLQKGGTNPFKQLGKQLDDKGIPERVGEGAEKLNRSAQETADDVTKGTKRGYQNVKENTKSFTDDVKSAVDDLGNKARSKTDDVKSAVDDLGDKARSRTNDLKNDIRKAS